MKRDDVINEARRWVGTPFHHSAHTIGVGCDCLGLIYGVALSLGLTSITLPSYAREPDGDQLEAGLGGELLRITKTDIRPADVMVFRFARYPQHVGLFTGSGVIHSYQRVGKCVEHSLDKKWQRRYVAAYRFKVFV